MRLFGPSKNCLLYVARLRIYASIRYVAQTRGEAANKRTPTEAPDPASLNKVEASSIAFVLAAACSIGGGGLFNYANAALYEAPPPLIATFLRARRGGALSGESLFAQAASAPPRRRRSGYVVEVKDSS